MKLEDVIHRAADNICKMDSEQFARWLQSRKGQDVERFLKDMRDFEEWSKTQTIRIGLLAPQQSCSHED